jgi:hypothetical protein
LFSGTGFWHSSQLNFVFGWLAGVLFFGKNGPKSETQILLGELGLSAVPLTILAAECRPGAVERAMSEVEFDRIVDAVRKEIAIVPAMHSFSGLRAFDGRVKAAADKPASPRHAPLARIRRVGEGRKRYR